MRVGVRGWLGGCAKDSIHTEIIDRLEPSGKVEDSCEGSKFWSASLKVCLGHGVARGISSRQ